MLSCHQVAIGGFVHKLTNLVDIEIEIGSCEGKVLKSTYKASKRCRIKERVTLSWG